MGMAEPLDYWMTVMSFADDTLTDCRSGWPTYLLSSSSKVSRAIGSASPPPLIILQAMGTTILDCLWGCGGKVSRFEKSLSPPVVSGMSVARESRADFNLPEVAGWKPV